MMFERYRPSGTLDASGAGAVSRRHALSSLAAPSWRWHRHGVSHKGGAVFPDTSM
jgi:hypothetical protein